MQHQNRLHACQWQVYQSTARFRVLVAGRRFGKTHLALAEILRAAGAPGRIVWYVGPNEGQSRRIVWDRLKEMTRQWWAKTPNETQLRIDLVFGSTIFVNGAYHPDSLRGNGIDFLVLDEFGLLPPESWNEVFRPALADRKGRALFIGTPQGRNHFYEFFEYAKTDPDWEAFQFTTAQGCLVDEEELQSAARQLDPETYQREYGGAFTSVNKNRVYYAFDREQNVRPVQFDKMQPLVWSIDFNVNPMCMLLLQRDGDMVYVIEEIVIKPEAHTEAACQAFLVRAQYYNAQLPYFLRPFKIHVYGDASGNQRRTSGASTDWTLIRQFFNTWRGTFEPSYYMANINPVVRDRVNCVNARLRNQVEESHLVISPSCVELIKDMEQVSWELDKTGAATCEINKSDKARTHASDALGYYISQVFSLKPRWATSNKGGNYTSNQTGRPLS